MILLEYKKLRSKTGDDILVIFIANVSREGHMLPVLLFLLHSSSSHWA